MICPRTQTNASFVTRSPSGTSQHRDVSSRQKFPGNVLVCQLGRIGQDWAYIVIDCDKFGCYGSSQPTPAWVTASTHVVGTGLSKSRPPTNELPCWECHNNEASRHGSPGALEARASRDDAASGSWSGMLPVQRLAVPIASRTKVESRQSEVAHHNGLSPTGNCCIFYEPSVRPSRSPFPLPRLLLPQSHSGSLSPVS